MAVLGSAVRVCSCECAPSAAIRRSSARLLASGIAHNKHVMAIHSPVFRLPKLVSSLFRRRVTDDLVTQRPSFSSSSTEAEVGAASVEEELKELPGDEKPKQSWHSLPSGLRLEVLTLEASESSLEKAPLVFVHGSFHAAWCWAVHWLPYFSSLGHDCYALSLLGQGASDTPLESGPANTIQSHARDISHFISQRCKRPPVLIGHSFGGLVVQYYLSQVSTDIMTSNISYGWGEPYWHLAGAVLVCSVPPTGLTAVVKRFFMSKPIASIKVSLSLAAKMFATSLPLCRETFFSPSMPEKDVAHYQKLMKDSSQVPIVDIRNLSSSLPVPPPVKNFPLILVVGAENDFTLDEQAIEETANFLGTKEVIVPGIAHDVMLDIRWRDAANVLKSWMLTNLQPL